MSSTKQIRLNFIDQSPYSANSTDGADRQHLLLRLGRGDHEVSHLLNVAFVGDVDRDDDASDSIVIDPVLDDAADEVRVGNNQAAAVEGLDLCRTSLDRADNALVGSPATRSPTRIVRSHRRMGPETKLLAIVCRPKPMPTDKPPAMRASFWRSRQLARRPASRRQ